MSIEQAITENTQAIRELITVLISQTKEVGMHSKARGHLEEQLKTLDSDFMSEFSTIEKIVDERWVAMLKKHGEAKCNQLLREFGVSDLCGVRANDFCLFFNRLSLALGKPR